jgi:hypothetical protein
MRHRFAAHTLIHWYRAGLDVERELPKLSTYLGHVDVNDTYWYLEAVPERQASPHTIAGYRDFFRLLLRFAKKRLSKMPSQIRIEDLDALFIALHVGDFKQGQYYYIRVGEEYPDARGECPASRL